MGKNKTQSKKDSKKPDSKENGKQYLLCLSGKSGKGGKGRSKKDNSRNGVVTDGADDFSFRQSVEDGSRTIIDMDADGNCLFRSLSDQLYYDYGNSHGEVRSDVCDFMQEHKSDFQHFLVIDEEDDADVDAADFESYVRNMRESGNWGGNLELVAAARLYRRNIIVYSAGHALTIGHGQDKSGGTDMMVSYHENDHYNSVRDNSVAKPPPPSKIKTWSIIESSDSLETEAELLDQDEIDDPVTKQKVIVVELTRPNAKPAKKNDPCPCASGLKFKKCCWVTDKSKERARKWKQKHGLAEETDDDAEADNIEIDGGFKVLKI